MGDLDLLVEEVNFERVLTVLLEVGFEIDFRSDLKDSILDQVLVDREAELSFDVGDG